MRLDIATAWVSAAVMCTGCGGTAAPVDGDATPSSTTFGDAAFARARTICASASTHDEVVSRSVDEQTGAFTLELDATPRLAHGSALVGLASGDIAEEADTALALRFAPGGAVDVLNGDGYEPGIPVAYAPRASRRFRLDVDVPGHRYSVSELTPAGTFTFASNFAFRPEQQSVSSVDHYGLVLDGGGSLQVCNLLFGSCRTAESSAGFVHWPMPPQQRAFTASVSVTPTAAGIDGVVGFSARPASSLADLAVAVRFNPDGFIDALNGGTYSADFPQAYVPGTRYAILFLIDVIGHAYSVYVGDQTLARNYAFRRRHAPMPAVPQLTELTAVSDSEAGSLNVCDFAYANDPEVAWLHDALHFEPPGLGVLAALSNGELLSAVPDATQTIDARGDVRSTVPHGGSAILVDASDDRYLFGLFSGSHDGGGGPVASAGGSDVFVSKYDAAWNHVYTQSFGGTDDDELVDQTVNASGDVVLALGGKLLRLDQAGEVLWERAGTGLVALDGAGNTFLGTAGPTADGSFTISKLDCSGANLWEQAGTISEGRGTLLKTRSTPAGGIVLAGLLNGTLHLAGLELTARKPYGVAETFVAELDAGGAASFGTILDLDEDVDLVVDGLGRPSVGGRRFNPDRFFLYRLSAAGEVVAELSGNELVNGLFLGSAGPLVADRSGNLYWNFNPRAGADVESSLLVKLRPSRLFGRPQRYPVAENSLAGD